MNEMSVEEWCMKFVAEEKERNSEKNLPKTPFRPLRNPHGVTKTRIRDSGAAVGGERLTAFAAEPPGMNE